MFLYFFLFCFSSFLLCSQLKQRESEENIESHESFHDNLLKMEQWLMIIKQKFESFHSLQGKWSVDGREQEAEVCVGGPFQKPIRGTILTWATRGSTTPAH